MDYDKLIDDLRVACAGNQYNIMGVAATALSTLQAENEKLREELEQAHESLDFARTKDAEIVRLGANLARVTAERDALIKRATGDCWSCIRRYECNSRKGPHSRCWEFDPWLLKED